MPRERALNQLVEVALKDHHLTPSLHAKREARCLIERQKPEAGQSPCSMLDPPANQLEQPVPSFFFPFLTTTTLTHSCLQLTMAHLPKDELSQIPEVPGGGPLQLLVHIQPKAGKDAEVSEHLAKIQAKANSDKEP